MVLRAHSSSESAESGRQWNDISVVNYESSVPIFKMRRGASPRSQTAVSALLTLQVQDQRLWSRLTNQSHAGHLHVRGAGIWERETGTTWWPLDQSIHSTWEENWEYNCAQREASLQPRLFISIVLLYNIWNQQIVSHHIIEFQIYFWITFIFT